MPRSASGSATHASAIARTASRTVLGAECRALITTRYAQLLTNLGGTPHLIERGKQRTAEEGVDIEWVEADAEALPCADASYDFSRLGPFVDRLRAAGEREHDWPPPVFRERLHRLHKGVYAVGHTVLTRRGRWMASTGRPIEPSIPARSVTKTTAPPRRFGLKGCRIRLLRMLTLAERRDRDTIRRLRKTMSRP